jgi:MFS family permease
MVDAHTNPLPRQATFEPLGRAVRRRRREIAVTVEIRPQPAKDAAMLDPLRVLALVGSLCAIYTVSQFLRNSVGVLAPELSRELRLAPEAIGLLSSVFFLSFAAAQIPLGILLDRYGPKRTMLGSLAIALVGAGLFAAAGTLDGLVLARILMGVGCSSFLMGPLVVYARWFPPARFSTLTGIQLGFGTLGTLLATAPLAYGAAAFGWRATFLIGDGIAAVTGLLLVLFVRDRPPGKTPPQRTLERLSESLAGVREAFRTKDVVPLFAMHFASYAALVTVLGLWGGPYLADAYGFGIERRGELLFLLAAANILGMLAWGPLDRTFGSRKRPVAAGAAATAALLTLLSTTHLPPAWLAPLFLSLGFANGYVSIQIAHGRAIFPDPIVGRGMTLLNMATMAGTFVLQLVTGIVVGMFPAEASGARPLVAYQFAFGIAAATLAAALLLYLIRAGDRPPN